MAVTHDRRGGVVRGVTGHQSQLWLGLYRSHRTSCEAQPPLVQVVPAIVITITSNSNHEFQQCTGLSVTVPTPGPYGPDSRV